MQLNLYKNFKKRINSTKIPSGGVTVYDVKMKQGTSIENPTFVIQGIEPEYNYAWWNGHYYFITDIIYSNNNIYEIQCKQDVLATYKTDIQAYNCFVERADSYYDEFLEDNAISVVDDIENGALSTIALDNYSDNGLYITRIAGLNDITTLVTTDLISLGAIFNLTHYGITDVTTFLEAVGLDGVSPSNYITSCKWIPFSAAALTGYSRHTASSVNIGQFTIPLGTSVTAISSSGIANGSIHFTKEIALPIQNYEDFRKYSARFTKIMLYLPGVGNVPLQPQDFQNTVKVEFTMDIVSGTCTYVIYSGVRMVTKLSGNLSVDVQLSVVGNDTRNFYNVLGGSGANIAGSLLGGAMTSGGVGAVVSGAVGAVGTAYSAINTWYQSDNVSVINSQGDFASIKAEHSIKVSLTEFKSADIPNTYGRPLCKNATLGSMSGYIQCANASVNMEGTDSDKSEVNSYLNSGFYME